MGNTKSILITGNHKFKLPLMEYQIKFQQHFRSVWAMSCYYKSLWDFFFFFTFHLVCQAFFWYGNEKSADLAWLSIPTCVGSAVSFQMGTFCVDFFTSRVVTDVGFTFLLQGRGAAGRGRGRGGRSIQLWVHLRWRHTKCCTVTTLLTVNPETKSCVLKSVSYKLLWLLFKKT